ncbi:MAG: hypothetical protein HFH27_10065 [Clostridiaceae bacterium]|nr:hypothetical protein [Clostridiaceae bacterium]
MGRAEPSTAIVFWACPPSAADNPSSVPERAKTGRDTATVFVLVTVSAQYILVVLMTARIVLSSSFLYVLLNQSSISLSL